MIYIFGISGKAGSGKDTLAQYLIDKLTSEGISAKRVAFADQLKVYAEKYFPDICDVKVKDPVSRKVLQGLGQFARETVDENFWVDIVRDQIYQETEDATSGDRYYFITDVRYENEADLVSNKHEFISNFNSAQDYRNYLIRIDGRTSLTGKSAEHKSECDLDMYPNFDFVYNNTQDLDGLYKFAENVIESTREVSNGIN